MRRLLVLIYTVAEGKATSCDHALCSARFLPVTTAKPLRLTADRLLRRDAGVALDEFVLTRRGHEASWRQIAADLLLTTDGILDITPEAIRQWFGEADQAA